ncbi:MAG: protein kinase [Planctomycetes bacterium]|nr:protein kinase [Planctomycetota bacterium]
MSSPNKKQREKAQSPDAAAEDEERSTDSTLYLFSDEAQKKIVPTDFDIGPLKSEVSSPELGKSIVLDTKQPSDLIGKVLGKCRIEKLIGKGGMGAVYLARHQTLQIEVAIKVLPPAFGLQPEYLERFYREARAAASLSHKNIVSVMDVDESEGVHYIVMEYVRGKTVEDMMGLKRRLPQTKALTIAIGILRALAHAHEKGFIHRDIKPDNIFLTDKGEIKVGDFGLVHTGECGRAGEMQEDKRLTATSQVMGTPHYMSPEQIEGTRNVDARTDIYSVGVMLYYMLTGERPFEGDSTITILMKHLQEEAPPASAVNPEIEEAVSLFIAMMMAKAPADRIQSATDALKSALNLLKGIKSGEIERLRPEELIDVLQDTKATLAVSGSRVSKTPAPSGRREKGAESREQGGSKPVSQGRSKTGAMVLTAIVVVLVIAGTLVFPKLFSKDEKPEITVIDSGRPAQLTRNEERSMLASRERISKIEEFYEKLGAYEIHCEQFPSDLDARFELRNLQDRSRDIEKAWDEIGKIGDALAEVRTQPEFKLKILAVERFIADFPEAKQIPAAESLRALLSDRLYEVQIEEAAAEEDRIWSGVKSGIERNPVDGMSLGMTREYVRLTQEYLGWGERNAFEARALLVELREREDKLLHRELENILALPEQNQRVQLLEAHIDEFGEDQIFVQELAKERASLMAEEEQWDEIGTVDIESLVASSECGALISKIDAYLAIDNPAHAEDARLLRDSLEVLKSEFEEAESLWTEIEALDAERYTTPDRCTEIIEDIDAFLEHPRASEENRAQAEQVKEKFIVRRTFLQSVIMQRRLAERARNQGSEGDQPEPPQRMNWGGNQNQRPPRETRNAVSEHGPGTCPEREGDAIPNGRHCGLCGAAIVHSGDSCPMRPGESISVLARFCPYCGAAVKR